MYELCPSAAPPIELAEYRRACPLPAGSGAASSRLKPSSRPLLPNQSRHPSAMHPFTRRRPSLLSPPCIEFDSDARSRTSSRYWSGSRLPRLRTRGTRGIRRR